MDAIVRMFAQFAGMVGKLFSAGEKYASALEHTGRLADEAAGTWADEASHKRKLNVELQRQEFEVQLKQRKKELTQRTARLQLPE